MSRSLLPEVIPIAAALGLSALGSVLGLMIARRLTNPKPFQPQARVLRFDGGTVELKRTIDTELTGHYAVKGPNGRIEVGEILKKTAFSVTRRVLNTALPSISIHGQWDWDSSIFESPSDLDADADVRDIVISTSDGDLPAWVLKPNNSNDDDVWTIHVHGHSTQRRQVLRGVRTFLDAGYPSIVTTYRNDHEGPATHPAGHTLGVMESRDVDAAISAAVDAGAKRVVLVGWSMGAMIAFQSLLRNQSVVVGLVGVSPVTSIEALIESALHRLHLPRKLSHLPRIILRSRGLCQLANIGQPIDIRSLAWSSHLHALKVPVLLIHSDGDSVMPIDSSIAVSRQSPLITLAKTQSAPHTLEWNADERAWDDTVKTWLTKHQSVLAPEGS